MKDCVSTLKTELKKKNINFNINNTSYIDRELEEYFDEINNLSSSLNHDNNDEIGESNSQNNIILSAFESIIEDSTLNIRDEKQSIQSSHHKYAMLDIIELGYKAMKLKDFVTIRFRTKNASNEKRTIY